MIIAYIAHPIAGDVENNLSDIRRIVRKINLDYPDVVPFVPYYSDIVSLDDNIPEERARGIKNDIVIIKSGMVNQFWLTGDRVSAGMQHELDLASSLGIPVFNKLHI